jgi:poly-gamma-glutamate synthesis protein (capsule biosynthesis protein)
VANNHALQYGAAGFQDTLQALGRAGIAAAGVAAAEFLCVPVLKTVNGVRVGLLAYSQAAENFYQGEPLYARWDDMRVRADIARLRPEVDFLVVSCHWGVEQIDYAPPSVVRAARAVVDAGADVVLGHHSHIFQSVETYRHGLICYSLGNFVFDTLWERFSTHSAIVEITLELRDGGKHIAHEVIPVRINAQYQPEPLTGAGRDRFLARLEDIRRGQADAARLEDLALQRMTAERERDLGRRKILHVLRSAHRVSAATWRVLFLDKLSRRLGFAPAAAPPGPGGC